MSKEAAHVEWFAKECAVVTHHRLKTSADGKSVEVDPDAKLEEELIVRPTSETIIRNTYKKRITSHRDLPLLINQRANVVRRELRTRLFLRTAEFLWQEWHTAHATADEADAEARKMLDVYHDFTSHFMGLYSVTGKKSPSERFAGAVETYTFEPMMQDGKALQAGTSHNLGQNFAKAFDVTYTNTHNELEHVRATSWWVSTRLMWGLVMAHGDDQGLVLPPALAPYQLVIVPIAKTDEDKAAIKEFLQPVIDTIKQQSFSLQSEYFDRSMEINVHIDETDGKSPWRKFAQRELQGAPLRIGIGKRDIEQWQIELYRRDTQEKKFYTVDEIKTIMPALLEEIHQTIYQKHQSFSQSNTRVAHNYDEFKEYIEQWFVLCHRDGTDETEAAIQEETKGTIRCLPFAEELSGVKIHEAGICIYSWKPSSQRVLFAKAY